MILSVDEKKSSKKELKELRRIEELRLRQATQKQNMVKWIIIGGLSLIFLTFFTAIIIVAKQNAQIITLSSDGWVRGKETAKVTLVEFGDLQCPACKSYEPIVEQLLVDKDLSSKVKLLFKHFPLTSIHKNALGAAKAAEAAGAQGKFWEYHDLLYQKQEEWSELAAIDADKMFVQYADDLKLDKTRFKLDLTNQALADKITKQTAEGDSAGVLGTPSFFVNNKKIDPSPQSFAEFKSTLLKEAK